MIIDYQASFYSYELSRVGITGIDRLGRGLFDVCVDMNPYQIEAGFFALGSPRSKSSLLPDEVCLGKTNQADPVMCQYLAERRRSILAIIPASLCKQWEIELPKICAIGVNPFSSVVKINGGRHDH